MVCFNQFVYKVSKADLPDFIPNANRYFPGVAWKVSVKKGKSVMTIETTDLNDAVNTLAPTDSDTITFDTGRVWDSLSFWNVLPRMKPCIVSDEQRQKLTQQAKVFTDGNDSDEQNVNRMIDWSTINELMTLVHELSPVKSYVALPSCNMVIFEPMAERYGGEPGLSCRVVKDGQIVSCYAPHLIFDMDDGFCDIYQGNVPQELSDAFEKWVDGGRKGPVFA